MRLCSQPTFTHGVHRGRGIDVWDSGGTPNPHSRTGCIPPKCKTNRRGEAPNPHSRTGCIIVHHGLVTLQDAPNPHSRTGCIGKTPQNMSRMYGIYIHNLYLIECCDRARFMEACQLRPASRFLGVESPMPMVRKHQRLMFASAPPFLCNHQLSF